MVTPTYRLFIFLQFWMQKLHHEGQEGEEHCDSKGTGKLRMREGGGRGRGERGGRRKKEEREREERRGKGGGKEGMSRGGRKKRGKKRRRGSKKGGKEREERDSMSVSKLSAHSLFGT